MIEFELIDDSQTIDVNLIDDTETIEVGLIKEIDKYPDLKELPSINDVTLIGNKTLHDLGIQPEGDYVEKVEGKGLSTNDYTNEEKQKLFTLENYDDTEVRELIDTKQPRGNYLTEETDPTVPSHVKSITQEDINNWNNPSFTGDYEELSNLPKVNNITLKGNKTLSDLGIQPAGNYLTTETDPTVPNYVKAITQNDITNWNNKADESDIPDVSDFITKDVNNLTYYTTTADLSSFATTTELGNETTARENADIGLQGQIDAITSSSDVKDIVGAYTELQNYDTSTLGNDDIIKVLQDSTHNEAMTYYRWVISGSSSSWQYIGQEGPYYTKSETETLLNNKQNEITSSNKLASDLVDDSNSGNKFVTSSQKTSWNSKYDKPNGGIPKTDLASDVQTSLEKADTAVQKDGGSATQTVSLSSGTGTTALAVKSRATSSYISFSNNSAWVGSIGVTSDKKPTFYNGSSYMLAYTSDIPKYYIGTSETAAATRLKVVECEGFVLEEGATISVTFTNAQTYNGSPQLNVNGTGAIIVQSRAGTNGVRYLWSAGEIIDFTYDGTYWVCHGRGFATTSYYGVTKLYTSAASDSQAYALTPRSLYYFANYSIAPYYSSSKTYAVGDKVRYSYYIYECITAIDEPESWNAEHWQQADTIQEQIDNIYTYIDSLNGNGVSY